MKRRASPVLVLVAAVVILAIHVAAIFLLDRQYRIAARAVRAQEQELARRQASRADDEDEKIPTRYRPQGVGTDPAYSAEFYRVLGEGLRPLLPITVGFLLFAFWFTRPHKTG